MAGKASPLCSTIEAFDWHARAVRLSAKLTVGLVSSEDAKRSVAGKAMELHEVEAGALKATDPLSLPAFLEGELTKATPATAGKTNC